MRRIMPNRYERTATKFVQCIDPILLWSPLSRYTATRFLYARLPAVCCPRILGFYVNGRKGERGSEGEREGSGGEERAQCRTNIQHCQPNSHSLFYRFWRPSIERQIRTRDTHLHSGDKCRGTGCVYSAPASRPKTRRGIHAVSA